MRGRFGSSSRPSWPETRAAPPPPPSPCAPPACESRTRYVLDEPTTGLHGEDGDRLLAVLRRVVDRGDTVLVIEHHLDLVARCDHLIDLGPEGGAGGGQVVVAGTVREVAACAASHTGVALRTLYGGALPPIPERVQPSRTHA